MRRLRRNRGGGSVLGAPGWYPHSERPEEEWYWDGTDWTESRWAKPWRRKRRASRNPAEFLRVKFRVAFDGQWQEDFDTLVEAVEWAQHVATTGRTTWVVEQRPFSVCLRATFPAERADAARQQWERVHDWRRVIGAFGTGFGP